MRAVVQRVSRARVAVNGEVTGEIAAGLMILIGVGRDDTSAVALTMAEKIANLRIFEDDEGKMNRSLLEVNGSALVVSQFTLYGDARGQRRPSFIAAAPPEQAKKLYEEFSEGLRTLGVIVATGVFQAMMSVELVNEGPVTIQRRLAHAGSYCRDRSFPGDDVGGISERRPCHNPSRFRQKILDSRNSGYSRPTKKAKRSRMLRDELPEYPATAVRRNVL